MRLKYDVDTKILFQIGDPLDQCCATYLHNALYEFANINAVNLSVPVPKGGLGDFVKAAKTIHAAGFDLTMPTTPKHSEAALPAKLAINSWEISMVPR